MKAKKLTPLQKEALKDILTHGELSRLTAHDEFRPGGHRGQTVVSLVDRGLLEVYEKSYLGYPLIVKPTAAASWDLATT